MFKKVIFLLSALLLNVSIFSGCAATQGLQSTQQSSGSISQTAAASSIQESVKKPKYIFLFIGDGMAHTQVNSAQVYKGNNTLGEVSVGRLNFTQFPIVGLATTQDATSFCPDSASTATAIAGGVKTHSGVLGLEADKTTAVQTIAEKLKLQGIKVGIVSTVTLNHATPAAFYAHSPSRNEYYDIALQMADSGFDYFGGGTLSKPTDSNGDQRDAFDILKEKGYTVADSVEAIRSLNTSSGKVYAVSPKLQDSGSMPYTLDTEKDDITLADFVEKGIEILDNEKGFFMMVESGKIDWACHANDGMSAISDVLGFDDSIQKAVDFAVQHPDETLIIVTADHETGGMTIGYAATGYNTAFNILERQKISYVAFDKLIGDMKKENPNLVLEDVLPIIKEKFGLIVPTDPEALLEENTSFVLTEYEYKKLENGFAESVLEKDKRTDTEEASLLYGGYDPLSVSITHIINNKAGIGWTSYSHTGTPVPVFAMGVGAERFGGSYDNTDINKKLLEITGLN